MDSYRLSSDSDHRDCERLILTTEEPDTEDESQAVKEASVFSWLEYSAFFVVGLSMMWTWSAILQAVPYFKRRFEGSSFILRYFQASNLIIFAIALLFITIYLSSARIRRSYSRQLRTALLIYVAVGVLLTLSTITWTGISALPYFIFIQSMVLLTALANGLSQNSVFAFVAGFGRTEYVPAIMTGEALAALLPSVIEISSALAFPSDYFQTKPDVTSHTSVSTIFYFSAVITTSIASLSALSLLRKRNKYLNPQNHTKYKPNRAKMWIQLKWPALANFGCLCISAVSPVFAAKILSLHPAENAPIILRPEAYVPLAIVLWNVGDLLGSILSVTSTFLLRRPGLIFVLSMMRIGFIPLYVMCNIDGKGSVFGDWFYLIVVQFLFGLSHGWISGVSMMGVSIWVDKEDREEAGAFMGMVLVGGLVAGSAVGLAAARV